MRLRVKGQKDAPGLGHNKSGDCKLQGPSTTSWSYLLPETAKKLGVTRGRSVTIRPAVAAAGKTVRGKWLTLTAEDL